MNNGTIEFLRIYPSFLAQACKWWAGIPETTGVKSVISVKRFIGQTLSEEKLKRNEDQRKEYEEKLVETLKGVQDYLDCKIIEKKLEQEFLERTKYTIDDVYEPCNMMEIEVFNNQNKKESVFIKNWDTKPEIDVWQMSFSELLSDPHVGSASIAVAILTLPFTLLLSPLLLTINGVYFLLEKVWGISRRTHKLYSGLVRSNLLNNEDKEIVKQACINMEKQLYSDMMKEY